MDLQHALTLVREKYQEEQKDITTGENAEKYEQFLEEYPVTMATAQYILAIELCKNMP